MRILFTKDEPTVRGENASESLQITVDLKTVPIAPIDPYETQVEDLVYLNVPDTLEKYVFSIITNDRLATFVSKTPAIATVDTDGNVEHVSDGLAEIEVSGEKLVKEDVAISVVSVGYSEIIGFAVGSLGHHMVQEVGTRIDGVAHLSNTESIFSNWSTDLNDITENDSLWCADVELSGLTAIASTTAEIRSAELISPRHIAGATHHRPTEVSFLGDDGVIVTRTVSSWTAVENKPESGQTGDSDLSIGYLDAAVPSTVHPLKVLPANWESYLPNADKGVPVLFTTHGTLTEYGRSKVLRLVDIRETDTVVLSSAHEVTFKQSLDAIRSEWYHPAWQSGTALTAIVNGELLYFAEMHNSIPGGVCISYLIPEVNAIMIAQHGNNQYQLQEVDLTGFPTY